VPQEQSVPQMPSLPSSRQTSFPQTGFSAPDSRDSRLDMMVDEITALREDLAVKDQYERAMRSEVMSMTASLKVDARARDAKMEAAKKFQDASMDHRNGHEYNALMAGLRHIYAASELLGSGGHPEAATELKLAIDVLKLRALFIFSLDKVGANAASSAIVVPYGSFLSEFPKELEDLRKAKASAPQYHSASSSSSSSSYSAPPSRPLRCYGCQGPHLLKDCTSPTSSSSFRPFLARDRSPRDRSPRRDDRRDQGRERGGR